MKVNILNWGVRATHEVIEELTNIGSNRSISDYDAFVLDPFAQVNVALGSTVFYRRQREIGELVNRKGGIVVCLLRPEAHVLVDGSASSCYDLLDAAALMAVR